MDAHPDGYGVARRANPTSAGTAFAGTPAGAKTGICAKNEVLYGVASRARFPQQGGVGSKVLATIGTAVRHERKARGLSQAQLAHNVGLERSYFGRIERGMHNVSVLTLARIALTLEVPLASLIGDVNLERIREDLERGALTASTKSPTHRT